MKDWIIWSAVYVYLAQVCFRELRRPSKRALPWWLTITLTVLAPLVCVTGLVMMVPDKVPALRHFRFRGFGDRQRRNILGDLAGYQPDDGGFLDAATPCGQARQAMAQTARTDTASH